MTPSPLSAWHSRAPLRNIAALGTRWLSDHGAAISSGDPAPDARGESAMALRRMILMVSREPAEPRTIGDRVLVGPAVIDAAYYGLIMELYPSATWEAQGELDPVVAMAGDRAVAVVMPLRKAEKQ